MPKEKYANDYYVVVPTSHALDLNLSYIDSEGKFHWAWTPSVVEDPYLGWRIYNLYNLEYISKEYLKVISEKEFEAVLTFPTGVTEILESIRINQKLVLDTLSAEVLEEEKKSVAEILLDIRKSIEDYMKPEKPGEPFSYNLSEEEIAFFVKETGAMPPLYDVAGIVDVVRQIVWHLSHMGSVMKGKLLELWKFVWEDIIKEIPKFTVGIFSSVIEWLKERWLEIKKGLGLLWGGLKDIWSWVSEVGVSIWDGIRRAMVDIIPGIAEGIYKWISQGLSGTWKWIADYYQTTMEGITYGMMSVMQGLFAVTPEQAPSVGNSLCIMAMAGGLMVHSLSIIGEHTHPTKEVGWNYLGGFLSEFTGYKRITDETYGVLLRQGLGKPYTYWAKDKFRTQLPDEKWLTTMAVKPDIDMGTFYRYMAYHGYSNFWAGRIAKTMWREPSPFELGYMLNDISVDPEWITRKMRRRGFNQEDSDVLTYALVQRGMNTARLDYLRACVDIYKKGFCTDVQLDEYLWLLGIRPEQNELVKKMARMKYIIEYTDDAIWKQIELYRADIITIDELETSIVGLGVKEEIAHMTRVKEGARKRGYALRGEEIDIEKQIRSVQTKYQQLYRKQFEDGIITKKKYIEYLVQLGYIVDYAESIAELDDYKRMEVSARQELKTKDTLLRKEQTAWKNAYVAMFRKDLISDGVLEEYLLRIGLDEKISVAIVETEKTRKYKPPEPDEIKEKEKITAEVQKRWKDVYIEMFRRDMIEKEELTKNLIDIGILPEIAEPIVEKEIARKYEPTLLT